MGYTCTCCGEYHDEELMDLGFDAPYYWDPKSKNTDDTFIDSDVCVIDNEDYFIRGVLEIPVKDSKNPFAWGVWVSLSKQNFRRYLELYEKKKIPKDEPHYFGWLSNDIPGYSKTTLSLKTHVEVRGSGWRPLIFLEPTDHPLAVEQLQGITMERVHELTDPTQKKSAKKPKPPKHKPAKK